MLNPFLVLIAAPEVLSLLRRSEPLAHEVSPTHVVGTFPSNTGYVVDKWYSDAACNNLMFIHNIVASTCLKTGSGSIMYQCNSTSQTALAKYSGSSCGDVSTVTTIANNACLLDPKLGLYHKITDCGHVLVHGDDFGNGKWFSKTYYAGDSTCEGEKIIHSLAYINGHCYTTAGSKSKKYEFPNVYFYDASTDCTGTFTSTQVDNSCVERHNIVEVGRPVPDDDHVVLKSFGSDDDLALAASINSPSFGPALAPARQSFAPFAPTILSIAPVLAPNLGPSIAPVVLPPFTVPPNFHAPHQEDKAEKTLEQNSILSKIDEEEQKPVDVLVQSERADAQQFPSLLVDLHLAASGDSDTFQQYDYSESDATTTRVVCVWTIVLMTIFSVFSNWK